MTCDPETPDTSRPSSRSQGACVWLTGLSGAGKSTTAVGLCEQLTSAGYTAVLIDGDALRRSTIPPLGFSRSDRDANVLHAAALARDVANGDGIAVCALISPYRETRAAARQVVGSPRFVEVFVDTPLRVCQARDPTGLYDRARRHEIRNVSGVDDPYEPPIVPELILRTEGCTPADNVTRLMAILIDRRLIGHAARLPVPVDA